MYSNYFFVRNTALLARQYNWSNMFNTIITCRLSHYFRLKTCSLFLSHSHVFHLMFVINYVTVLSGKYPANFTRISDSTCLRFTGYRIVLSGSGTSLILTSSQPRVGRGLENSLSFPDMTKGNPHVHFITRHFIQQQKSAVGQNGLLVRGFTGPK